MSDHISRPLDRFFGRERELMRLEEWLADPGIQLISLVGPPGAGKTRLSIETALTQSRKVWFCDLSSANDIAEMVDVIAAVTALDVKGKTTEERLDLLTDSIGALEPSIIILDNFENVVDEAARVVSRWATETDHTFLVTSTIALDVRGERLLSVGSLDTDHAVSLFLERAFEERGVEVSDDATRMSQVVAERLDGLPLAIELAARQFEFLKPDAIETQLDEAFEYLTSANRDRPTRHSSLTAMVEWGWKRLNETERKLMLAASVFDGGFTVDGLASVLDAPEGDVRDSLQGLRRKSMVSVFSENRFGLLNTLKMYASDRISDDRALESTFRARHVGFLSRISARWLPELNRAGSSASQVLDVERANIVDAIRWVIRSDVDDEVYDTALILGLVLYAAHDRRGFVQDTPELLAELWRAGREREVDLGMLARLRAVAGETVRRIGDPKGDAEIVAAVRDARESQDPVAIATTLMMLGEVLFIRGEREEALNAYREAVDAATRSEDQRTELDARQSYVIAKSFLGDFDLDEHEQVYQLALQVDDAWIAATCLTNIAIQHRTAGRLDEAITRFNKAIQEFQDIGDDATAGQVKMFLGIAYLYAEKYAEAEATLEEARGAIEHRGPESRQMIDLALAKVMLARGDFIEAEEKLEEIVRLASAANAFETVAMTCRELFFIACARRDEDAARHVAMRFPNVDTIRTFAERQFALAVLALVSDLDVQNGSPALDALGDEIEVGSIQYAYVELQKALLHCFRAWRTDDGDLKRAHEIVARVESSAAIEPQQVFELRRWFALFDAVENSGPVVQVGEEFTSIRPPTGEWIDLRKKSRTREILRILMTNHIETPGVALSAEELFDQAWPDTSIRHDSAMARVYTAISEIRKLGFDHVIESTDAGYLVCNGVRIEFV